MFEQPLPLSPPALAKVAPAVERAGIHLGVWPHDERPARLGHGAPHPAHLLRAGGRRAGAAGGEAPPRRESGKFVNVAVLEGDQIKIVDEHGVEPAGLPGAAHLAARLRFAGSWVGSVNVLVQLAVSMRAHGRGGPLLVVPADAEDWHESIVQPMPYAVSPPFASSPS